MLKMELRQIMSLRKDVKFDDDKSFFFLGNVFGGKDPFNGLGIFFDTYSNFNDEHSVSYFFVSYYHIHPF